MDRKTEVTSMEIMFSDYKEYEAGGVTYGIGLMNSMNDAAYVDKK